jgi:hypothetical protein
VRLVLLILIGIPSIALLGCVSPTEAPAPELAPEEMPTIPTPEPSPEPEPTELPPRPVTYTLTISVEPVGGGTVSQKDGTQRDTGLTFADISGYKLPETQEPEETVPRKQLTANATYGYIFDHWSGDASGTEVTIGIIMDSNKTVVAHFVEISTTCLELNTSYTVPSGLTVTVHSITVKEYAEYDECRIRYTLDNNTGKPHAEGTFKLWYQEFTGFGDPQTGLFSKLYPNESVTRSFTWSISKRFTAFLIEFEGNYLSKTPEQNTLKWLVPEYK